VATFFGSPLKRLFKSTFWSDLRIRRRSLTRKERYEWRKQCGTKFRHETILGALRHADHLRVLNDSPQMIYECEFCGWIHVGHVKGGILMYGAWADDIRELQGFGRKQHYIPVGNCLA
jgi:hypothetical protein